MSSVIKVENVSKKYLLNHIHQKNDYLTLRDSLSNIFKSSKKESYGEDFFALQDLNFDIKKGDRVGIIGRNGAGKSTLLKILSRITEPSSGRISIKGSVASLLEVGTGFHPELTGRENIFLNGAILGMSRHEIRAKFDKIVSFAEVEKFLDTPVKKYSSGMYVRLAFSVAAHLEPEILIVDEVLAVGDSEFQKRCLGKMNEVSQEDGRTILFVSHNISAIKALCTKGILLNKGQKVFEGATTDAINAYYDIKGNNGTQWVSDGEKTYNLRNDFLELKSLRLVNENSVVTDGHVFNHENLFYEMRFKVLKPGFNAGCIMYDESERVVYETTTLDNRNNPLKLVKVGEEQTIRVKIHNKILNKGRFQIAPLFFVEGETSFLHPKRNNLPHLTFEAEISGEMGTVLLHKEALLKLESQWVCQN